MKGSVRIMGVVFLTAIYCYAMGVVTESYTHPGNPHQPASPEKKLIAEFSSKQLCHTAQTENDASDTNHLSAPGYKNPLAGFGALAKAKELLLEASFSRYSSFAMNILIKYRKSDIVFPFHYFW
jgi:hypothetical protein